MRKYITVQNGIVLFLIFYWLSQFLGLWDLLLIFSGPLSLVEQLKIRIFLNTVSIFLMFYLFRKKKTPPTYQTSFQWNYVGLAFGVLLLDIFASHVYTQFVMNNRTITGQVVSSIYRELFYSADILSSFLVLVGLSFIGPLFEELFCRKMLMSIFFKDSKYYLDILFSASIFSLGHLFLVQFSIVHFFYYFIAGVLYGFLYRKTTSIYYSIVLHCIWNIYASWPYWLRWFEHVSLWIKLKF